jgi:hypothetical protein
MDPNPMKNWTKEFDVVCQKKIKRNNFDKIIKNLIFNILSNSMALYKIYPKGKDQKELEW